MVVSQDSQEQPALSPGREVRVSPEAHTVRPEIQALRALAVAAVVIYHVNDALLPGGFAGVDVFFVISGFLITSHIARALVSPKGFSLTGFYARRMRRLLPASLLVLLVVVALTVLFLPATLWHKNAVESLASVFYVQNWVLAGESVDYLAAAANASPVQHFWSLSVEEQFYLFWPLLLIVAARLSRSDPVRRTRMLVAVVGAVALVSFTWSVVETTRNPAPAYFVTTTRAWELAVGGFFALVLPRMSGPAWARGITGWAGFLLIGVSFWTLSAATLFPGWIAILPVAGAVLVIIAGDVPGPLALSRISNLRIVQFIGDISYSIYLWHWPMLVLVPILLKGPGYQLPLKPLLLVGALSIPVAWVSKRFVEDRFRTPRPGAATLVAGFTAMVVAGVAAAVPVAVSGHRVSEARASLARFEAADYACIGGESRDSGCTPVYHGPVQPDPVLETADPFECQQRAGRSDILTCHFGSSRADAKRIAVVGDSHANQWMPTLIELAAQRNWSLTTYLKSGCPFATGIGAPSCREWNAKLEPVLLAAHYDQVITAARSGAGCASKATVSQAVSSFERAWRPLIGAGAAFTVLADTPQLEQAGLLDPPSCVEIGASSCSITEAAAYKVEDALIPAAQATGAQLINMRKYFCFNGSCPSVIGDVLVYRDSNHMTTLYAQTLAGPLGRHLT